jgi:hypothetical protein
MRTIAALLLLCACSAPRDPCAGLGCASGSGRLLLQVHDASGAPIANPTFGSYSASCSMPADAGPCPEWIFEGLNLGNNAITISAAGFQSKTIMVDAMGPTGCCGRGPDISQTITLTP